MNMPVQMPQHPQPQIVRQIREISVFSKTCKKTRHFCLVQGQQVQPQPMHLDNITKAKQLLPMVRDNLAVSLISFSLNLKKSLIQYFCDLI